MEPEKDAGVATEEKPLDGKVDMSTDDSATSVGSSPEGTEGQAASGKDGKTTSKGLSPEEGHDDEVKDDGNPIPYERFKKVNDERKKHKGDLDALTAEKEGMEKLLNNPEVFRALLKSKGITDPAILDAKMKEAGFEVETKPEDKKELFKKFTEGLDPALPEDLTEIVERMFKYFSEREIAPIRQKLTEKEKSDHVVELEKEAQKLSKERLGIEYGVAGKDEGNPNTAVGKMMAYLKNNPQHAALGHSTILKLAMFDELITTGEKKGVSKEKERHKSLKSSAAEDGAQAGKDDVPTADWSVPQIMAWRRKHAK